MKPSNFAQNVWKSFLKILGFLYFKKKIGYQAK